MVPFILPLAGFIPVIILLAVIYFKIWQRKQRGERPPLSKKLLRPPGYGSQSILEELNESFTTWFAGAVAFAMFAACFQMVTGNRASHLVFLTIFGLSSALCTVKALLKLKEIRSYRRGLLGEQAVAEELQRLIPFGYQVFHDIPSDNKWNIDHAAVGPAGIFAIETKYRTKKPGKTGQREYEAFFDGVKIEFPWGFDTKAPEQAKANARWLANMLSKSTGERVNVQPIVALPGWLVTRKANSDVKILSGKEITGYISTEPARLSPETIQRVSYQLEQRCRDVEF